jgi:hypothetical protein
MSCNSLRIVFSLACCEKAEQAIREETPNRDSLQSFLSSLRKKKRASAISFANYKETPFLNIIDQFQVYVQFSVHNKALQIHLKN